MEASRTAPLDGHAVFMAAPIADTVRPRGGGSTQSHAIRFSEKKRKEHLGRAGPEQTSSVEMPTGSPINHSDAMNYGATD